MNYHNSKSSYLEDSAYRILSRTTSIGPNMDTLLGGSLQVILYKCSAGGNFWVCLHEESLENVVSDVSTRNELIQQSAGYDVVPVCEIKQNAKNPDDFSIIQRVDSPDAGYMAFMDAVRERFDALFGSFGAWTSFGDFLRYDNSYAVEDTNPLMQAPLDYWCLLTNAKGREGAYPVSKYPEGQVVTLVKDRLLPIFTSAIYADLYAQQLREARGIEINPQHMDCLKCFLGGIRSDLPEGTLVGCLLNAQWLVHGYSCGQFGDHTGHFFLREEAAEWALSGCSGREINPIWVERSWDSDGSAFSPSCGMSPWK